MRLYTKISLLIVSIVLVTGISAALLAGKIMQKTMLAELGNRSLILCQTTADRISKYVMENEKVKVYEVVQSVVRRTRGLEYIFVVGFDGTIFSHTFDNGFPIQLLKHHAISNEKKLQSIKYQDTDGNCFIDYSFPLIKGLDAHLHIGIGTSKLYAEITSLRQKIILGTILLIIVGAVVGIFLCQRFTKPLTMLRDAMISYGRGESEISFIPNCGGLEVEELSRVFMNMLAEKKSSEAALLESHNRFRALVEQAADAFFMHNENGDILDVNSMACESLGYSRDELLAMTVHDVDPSSENDQHLQRRRDLLASGQACLFESSHRRKNGTIFPVEIRLGYLQIEGNQYLLGLARDISIRKEADAALAMEKERLAITLRSIGDGVLTTDIKGNITLLNKVAEDLTGWSQDEALGKPLQDIFDIINEQTGVRAENPVEKVLAQGQIVGLANHTALIARDGTTRSIADSGAPIRDKESRIIGAVLVFRDMTEKNRLEKESLKVRKLESVGVLAGGIAHDFNNILAAILGNISLALTITEPNDEIYELLEESEKASLRAKDLTQQLLTFAKGGEPVKKLAAIDEVVRDSANFVLRGSNVRCDLKFEEELWPATIDLGQISQVIQNLIINARQAMPSGGTITINCSNHCQTAGKMFPLSSGNYIKIAVKDQGVGISADMLEKVFDPYFTTKQKGSGLGLAITHSIISKHDGYITVDSELGRGTTVTIYLPASLARPKLDRKNVTEPPTTGHGRVMIMDDEEMIRSLVEKSLSRIGYEVVAAKDGDEAVRLYRESKKDDAPIDLIIMDLTIPGGMGGKDAVKEIHEIDPEAKVIVSSGYYNDPVMANFKEYGFCAAMVKPFRMRELMEIVRKAVSSKSQVCPIGL